MSSGQKFADTHRHDPYNNYNYEVTFIGNKGIYKTGWNYVSGIKLSNNYTEYKEGGNNGVPVQIHSDSSYTPITMERGMSEDMDLINAINFQWDTVKGNGIIVPNKRWSIQIKIKDRDGIKVVKTITLYSAWITGYEMNDFQALDSGIAIDRIIVGYTNVDIS